MAIAEKRQLGEAERRLKQLGLDLPAPPKPFGTYEAMQSGNLLFLTGIPPTEDGVAKFIGRVGAELGVETGRQAASECRSTRPRGRPFRARYRGG